MIAVKLLLILLLALRFKYRAALAYFVCSDFEFYFTLNTSLLVTTK